MDQTIPTLREKRDGVPLLDFQALVEEADSLASNPDADNTAKKKLQDRTRYESAMTSLGVENYWPATIDTLKAYAVYLIKVGGRKQQKCSYNTLRCAFSALYEHNRLKYDSPIREEFQPILSGMLKNFANTHGSRSRKMKVLEDDEILKILNRMNAEIEHARAARKIAKVLTYCRSRAMFTIQLYGCMRVSELVQLNCNDIKFLSDRMKIEIRSTKTCKDGADIVIFKRQSHCALQYLKAYMNEGNLRTVHTTPLFRLQKPGERHILGKKRVSAISWNQTVKAMCKSIGLDTRLYGTHSLRRTAATSIVKNGGNTINLKQYGRWKSSAVDHYVEDGSAIKNRMSDKIFVQQP